jgi:hypothetical protein
VISTPSTLQPGLAAPIGWAAGPTCAMWPCGPSRSLASSLGSMQSCMLSGEVMTGGSAWRTIAAKVSSKQGSLAPGQFQVGMSEGIQLSGRTVMTQACLPIKSVPCQLSIGLGSRSRVWDIISQCHSGMFWGQAQTWLHFQYC